VIDFFPALRPVLHAVPPETAHRWTICGLRAVPTWMLDGYGRAADRGGQTAASVSLDQTVWGLRFANPVGMAAGFDKDAEVPGPLLRLGFGFVEVGTVTPRPQAGNPKPRVFRVRDQRALINRLGFNNGGVEAMAARLACWRQAGLHPIGVNIGSNRDSARPWEDFVACAGRLAPLADYLAINVSSPNTPGLRALQSPDRIRSLIEQVRAARPESGLNGPPVLVKLAPDFESDALTATVDAILEAGADGMIISNTTLSRPDGLTTRWRGVAGGLSGPPLFPLSTRQLARVYLRTEGKVPLIGVGGVVDPADAFEKIRAGARLVQLYTGLIYTGPALVGRLRQGVADRLAAAGFATIEAAVGSAAQAWARDP